MAKVNITISGIIGERSEMDDRFDKQMEGTGVESSAMYFSSQNMADFLQEPDTQAADEIEVTIVSPGGDVQHGLEIYDMLEAEKARGVNITTIGRQFDSIASVIMLAGDVRKAVKGCSPLIHNAWMSPADLDPSIKLNTQTLQLIEKDFEVSDAQILGEYVRKLGREKAYHLKAAMNADRELTDEEVLSYGFAQEIIEGKPSKAIRAVAFNSDLYKTVNNSNLTEMADQKELNARLSALETKHNESESFLAKLKNFFTGGQAKAMELPLEGGQVLFVEAGEGQPLEGSIAILSDGSPAPAGQHKLSDGRVVTIGEGGVITTIADAAPAEEVPDAAQMQAAIDAAVAKAMEEKEGEVKAMEEEKEEMAVAFQNLEKNFNAMKKELKALKDEVPGDENGKAKPQAYNLPEGKDWKDLKPSEQIRLRAMHSMKN